MHNDSHMNKSVAIGIFVLVIAVLVYITINKPEDMGTTTEPLSAQDTPMNTAAVVDSQNTDGVKITVLKEGTGEPAQAGDMVAMNYTGTLDDGTVFDSNIDPNFGHVEGFVFTLGANQVIKGWDVGVMGMKVGEKRLLVIDPTAAYGAEGAGGIIPPNATLTFEVELLAIK